MLTDRTAPRQPEVAHAAARPANRVETARALLAARRRRTAVFALPGTLLGEPAWDILLGLYVAQAEQRTADFDTLCAHADIPPRTALRWITALEELGLVRAEQGGATGVPCLHLTPLAQARMEDYLSSI